MKIRVLFLCTTNSVQSLIAESLLNRLDPEHFDATSAGISSGQPHPMVVEVLEEIGVNLQGRSSRLVRELPGSEFDFVISLSEEARIGCPELMRGERVHWQFDEFEDTSDPAKEKRWFQGLRDQIGLRVRLFALVQVRSKPFEVVTPQLKVARAGAQD